MMSQPLVDIPKDLIAFIIKKSGLKHGRDMIFRHHSSAWAVGK